VPGKKQLELDFEASDREAARLAAMPQKNDRRNRILQSAIPDGFDSHGQRVTSWTLKLVLLAINSFGDLKPSTKTIGKRCGDPQWQTLIPNGRTLSPRTVKSAIQALEKMDLLDRIDKGKRTERRVILWQYLKSPAMGATAPAMGATAPAMGATAAPQSQNVKPRSVTSDVDGARDLYFQEEASRILKRLCQAIGCSSNVERLSEGDRSLVTKVAWLTATGTLWTDAVEQVRESYLVEREQDQIHNPFAWLHTCMRNQCSAYSPPLTFDGLLKGVDGSMPQFWLSPIGINP
jgi:hypothetical protein